MWRKHLLGMACTLLLAVAQETHAYQHVEWTGHVSSTGEFEWETLTEVTDAVQWTLWKSLANPGDFMPLAGMTKNAAGEHILTLAYTLTEGSMQRALVYWLENFWFRKSTGEAAQITVLKIRKNGFDAAGVYKFRMYYQLLNPPVIKR